MAKTSRRYGPGERVAVLLPLAFADAYDYRIPLDLSLGDGDFVEVPLGPRRLSGVIWGPGCGNVDEARLRALAGLLPVPPLVDCNRRFVDWVADYTVHPRGAVLRMVMSIPEALRPGRPVKAFTLAGAIPQGARMTPARRRVLDVLADGRPRAAAALARDAGVGAGVVKALAAARIIEAAHTGNDIGANRSRPDPRLPGPALSSDQRVAADRVTAAIGAGFSVTLIDGVPGSGKTEVYFEAIAAALAAGRQVLVLLPEIALGAQWLARFRARFGADPAVWHSDLGRAERRRTWRSIAEGRAGIVIGARSALFLPFADLGLIVVDEEHDSSFKQEDAVTYNARDMAVVRARIGDFPVFLASATPSLETMVNVRAGRYAAVRLPARHGDAAMPAVELIDLRRDRPPRGRWLSPALRDAIAAATDDGGQTLLFLNRRGYAPLTVCRACGHRFQCSACSAWLVEHRFAGRLLCHHCGYSAPLPDACPACGATEALAACGPGVERLAEEVADVFPQARAALATSDTLSGPAATAELVRRIEGRDIDIVIGTQIMAKGYHFPHLTLVGVIDADLGLSGGDLRASERTFQLLYQASGRAGRGERAGRSLIQTTMPDHPVMAALASGDRARFLAAEENARREAAMPPFGRLAALIVSGTDRDTVVLAARALAKTAPESDGLRVFGPAPAPLALLRGRHRYRLLLHAGRGVAVPAVVRGWLESTPLPRPVRVQVDIDPYSFL